MHLPVPLVRKTYPDAQAHLPVGDPGLYLGTISDAVRRGARSFTAEHRLSPENSTQSQESDHDNASDPRERDTPWPAAEGQYQPGRHTVHRPGGTRGAGAVTL